MFTPWDAHKDFQVANFNYIFRGVVERTTAYYKFTPLCILKYLPDWVVYFTF